MTRLFNLWQPINQSITSSISCSAWWPFVAVGAIFRSQIDFWWRWSIGRGTRTASGAPPAGGCSATGVSVARGNFTARTTTTGQRYTGQGRLTIGQKYLSPDGLYQAKCRPIIIVRPIMTAIAYIFIFSANILYWALMLYLALIISCIERLYLYRAPIFLHALPTSQETALL